MGGTSKWSFFWALFFKFFMKPNPNFYKFFFKIILSIQVVYLIISFAVPMLPGWKMFGDVKRIEFKVLSEKGENIDYNLFLPKTVYNLNEKTVINLSKFICQKNNYKKIILQLPQRNHYVFSAPECDHQKL